MLSREGCCTSAVGRGPGHPSSGTGHVDARRRLSTWRYISIVVPQTYSPASQDSATSSLLMAGRDKGRTHRPGRACGTRDRRVHGAPSPSPELLIDYEEDRALRGALVGMLREAADFLGSPGTGERTPSPHVLSRAAQQPRFRPSPPALRVALELGPLEGLTSGVAAKPASSSASRSRSLRICASRSPSRCHALDTAAAASSRALRRPAWPALRAPG